MRIQNTLTVDFGGFELDADKITLKSVRRRDIVLPYTGALPAQLSMATEAHICFNIQVAQPTAVVLVLSGMGKNGNRCLLDASNGELMSLMDRFFSQKTNGGLTDFYNGLWRAHYIEWRKLTESPARLCAFLDGTSDQYRADLLEYIRQGVCDLY